MAVELGNGRSTLNDIYKAIGYVLRSFCYIRNLCTIQIIF